MPQSRAVVLRAIRQRIAALCAASLSIAGCCAFSGPRWRGEPSDHFDGAQFHNQEATEAIGVGAFLRWQRERHPPRWHDEPEKDAPAPLQRVLAGELRVTWIGHATLLIQLEGKNILTDPVWSERASPVRGIGPRRVHPPGMRFDRLPPIDAVLVSHNHYDHLDLATLVRLHRRDRPRFYVGLGNRELLEREGIDRVTELDWWQRAPLGEDLAIDLVPAQHFSMRGLCDRDATLWGGFVIEAPSGPVYFAGDTGLGPQFAQIRARFGPPRLALLPIGAYLPRWIMRQMHMSPDDAVRAHELLGAETSVAIHFDTFALADEAQGQAPAELRVAMAKAGIGADAFVVPRFGEPISVPARRADRP